VTAGRAPIAPCGYRPHCTDRETTCRNCRPCVVRRPSLPEKSGGQRASRRSPRGDRDREDGVLCWRTVIMSPRTCWRPDALLAIVFIALPQILLGAISWFGTSFSRSPLPAFRGVALTITVVLGGIWAPTPVTGFFLYYPSRRQMRPALKALVDFLRDEHHLLENGRKFALA
jgi:DNA-binding transcriptional LysR family regulator